MPRIRIHNFHNARLSVIQSYISQLICKEFPNAPVPGLSADHPIMQAASMVLDQIDQGALTDANAAIEDYKATRAAPQPTGAGTIGTTEDCLDLLVEYALAWVFDDTAKEQEIASEFHQSTCDPGWLTAAIAWLDYYWDGQAPQYVPPTSGGPQPVALPPPASADGQLRVGILGDWGTGEEEALAVLDQLMQQQPDLIIHVGDIYYAGTHDECITHFLQPIDAARTTYRSIPVYTLPGNHDYYSGGQGFYSILPQLNLGIPHAAVQKNSFFCLQNDFWQLEGMDTGYNDHDLLKVADDTTQLRADEADWHRQQIASAGERKVILFSHHQLFSAFATIGAVGSAGPSYRNPYLLQNLQAWSSTGKPNIVAWFWGHEHLLEVYGVPEPHVDLPVLGRCVGNSAFPVFIDEGDYTPKTTSVPLEPAPDFPDGYIQTGDDNLVYAHGYVLLTLAAGTGTAAYYQVNDPGSVAGASSQLLWFESLAAGY